MKALLGTITMLSIPLLVLNLLGGIISGIWLAFVSDWESIITGIFTIIVANFLLSIVLMPSLLLAAPSIRYAEKGKTIGFLFWGGLSNLYTIGVITFWCCGILFSYVHDASAVNLIPRLIWAYGIGTGPWAYMASQEHDNELIGTTLATFLSQLAFLVVIILVLFTQISHLFALELFGGFMLVGFVIQMTFVYFIQRENSQLA